MCGRLITKWPQFFIFPVSTAFVMWLCSPLILFCCLLKLVWSLDLLGPPEYHGNDSLPVWSLGFYNLSWNLSSSHVNSWVSFWRMKNTGVEKNYPSWVPPWRASLQVICWLIANSWRIPDQVTGIRLKPEELLLWANSKLKTLRIVSQRNGYHYNLLYLRVAF